MRNGRLVDDRNDPNETIFLPFPRISLPTYLLRVVKNKVQPSVALPPSSNPFNKPSQPPIKTGTSFNYEKLVSDFALHHIIQLASKQKTQMSTTLPFSFPLAPPSNQATTTIPDPKCNSLKAKLIQPPSSSICRSFKNKNQFDKKKSTPNIQLFPPQWR